MQEGRSPVRFFGQSLRIERRREDESYDMQQDIAARRRRQVRHDDRDRKETVRQIELDVIRDGLDHVLELGHGPILLLRVIDLVETGAHSPLGALMKVAPAPLVVR